jgi:hypothetical protein
MEKVMTKLEQLIREMESELASVKADYVAAHRQFDSYRGKDISLLDEKEVEATYERIVDKFKELYIVYNFIAINQKPAQDAVDNFDSFITQLKNSGNIREREPSQIITS